METHKDLRPLQWSFQRAKKVRRILLRTSSGAKACQRPVKASITHQELEKRRYHLTFYIYKLEDLQWEKRNKEKIFEQLCTVWGGGLPSFTLCSIINLLTSKGNTHMYTLGLKDDFWEHSTQLNATHRLKYVTWLFLTSKLTMFWMQIHTDELIVSMMQILLVNTNANKLIFHNVKLPFYF